MAAVLGYATAAALLFIHGSLPRHRAEAAWFIAGPVLLGMFALTSRAGTARATNERHGVTYVALPLFAGASLALYAPALGVGLLSDDFVLLHRAATGHLTMGTDFFRPVPMAVWWASGVLGASDAVLHAINALAHGVSGWLVYRLGGELGVARQWSVLAGAVFLTSPASVEPVVWVSALFDVAMTTGALAYLLGCLRGSVVVALAGLATALLSKESGIAIVPIALAAAALHRRSLRLPVLGLVVTIVFLGVRFVLLPPPDTYLAEPSRYLLKELVSRSFGAIALPWTGADIAASPLLALSPWLAAVALVALAAWRGMTRLALATAVLWGAWVIASVLPVYTYFFVAENLEASRYAYLGTAAFSLLLAQLAASVPPGRPAAAAATLLAATVTCGAIGVFMHQRAWVGAAAARDAVLRAARETIPASGCGSVAVEGLPDAVDGAFVFRNGFAEALQRHGIALPPFQTDAACAFAWNGRTFTVTR